MTKPEEAAAYWRDLTPRIELAPPAEYFDPLDLGDLEDGVIDEELIESESEPGKWYRLIRTNNGWQHYDTDCMGSLTRGDCHHVKEKNMETGIVPASGSALALIEEAEDQDIINAISGKIVETWVYTFPQGGSTVVGISSKGVEAAARELAKEGEAIREIDCVLTFEDENEARFLAKAGRYAVHADGREILLDVAVRGKRVTKFMTRTNGQKQPDESWYEKGITKAVRNAKLALLPENVQSYIIAQAAQTGRSRAVGGPQQRQARPQAIHAAPANVDGEVMATAEQKNALLQLARQVNALGADDAKKTWAEMHNRWPAAFPPPNTPGSNNYSALTSTDADAVAAYVNGVLNGEPVAQQGLPV